MSRGKVSKSEALARRVVSRRWVNRSLLAATVGIGCVAAGAYRAFAPPIPKEEEDDEATAQNFPPGAGDRPVEVVDEGKGFRVVKHAAGTTRILASPKRICGLAAADELLSLDVMPVAHSIADGNFPDYLKQAFADVPWIPNVYGSNLPNMEAILRVEPDLIIARTPSRQTYEQLSQIAPTVILLDHLRYYRERVLDVGTIIGQRGRAEARVAWFDAKVAAAREAMREPLGDASMALIRVRPKSYRLYGDQNHVSPLLYGDLQIRRPKLVSDRSWSSTMSPEGLLHLDADYLIVAADGSTGSARTMRDLSEHPVWQRTPAVRNGHVHVITKYRHWADAGILGRGLGIDDVVRAVCPQALKEVQAKADAVLRKDGA